MRQPANGPAMPQIAGAEQHLWQPGCRPLQLAPGKRFLVFSHSASPVTGATTIWEVGPRYPSLKLAFSGELDAVRRRANGQIVLVFGDITGKVEVVYNPVGNTLTPAFALSLHEMQHGSPIYPTVRSNTVPKSVRIRAASARLYAGPNTRHQSLPAHRSSQPGHWLAGDWRLVIILSVSTTGG